jgi:hypothetical protein
MKALSGLFTYGEDIPWDLKGRLAEKRPLQHYIILAKKNPEKRRPHFQQNPFFC